VKRLCAGAALAAVLAAAGCGGGGGGGTVPDGASVAPASAVAFVSVDTDFSSEQWKQVTKLAGRFPGTPKLIAELKKQTKGLDFDRDVKPALGPEVDLVWLDARNNGNDVVGLTKPDTKAKLEALLEKSRSNGESKAVTAQVGDWVAIADSKAKLDAFKTASAGDNLAGDKDFKQAFEKLPSDSSVRAWVDGGFVQSAMDGGLAANGAPPRLTHDVGDLRSISGSAKAEHDGARIELDGLISPTPDAAEFGPSLPNDMPTGALLYISTTRLDAPLRTILRLVGKSVPSFDTQLSQVEGVLGLSVENDIYPLLKGESAVAVYPGTARIPRVLFVQKVEDETKADSLLRRLSAIAQLSGSIKAETVQLGGETVQKLTFTNSAVTLYDGTAKGRLFVTNAPSLAEQTISGPADSLGDDPLFRSARDAAGMPGKVAAFAFGDMETGLPLVLRLAQQSGSVVPPEAFANVKPLHAAVAYLVKDGDALRISGFQTIK
jgi:Protein of unknown function (DUF3352)